MASLKEQAKKRRSGPVRRLDKGESVQVRFAADMDDEQGWKYLASYYDEAEKRTFYYENDDEVPNGKTVRESYFALAFDVEERKLQVWELRKMLVIDLLKSDDEYGNVTDRNYRLRRRGEGFKTEYTASPTDNKDVPKGMNKALKEGKKLFAEAIETLLEYSE